MDASTYKTTTEASRTNGKRPHNLDKAPSPPRNALPAENGRRTESPASGVERRLLERTLRLAGDPPFVIVLWGGEEIATCDRPPVARIHIRNRRTLWKVLSDPVFQFSEAFCDGRLEIEGDLVDVLSELEQSLRPYWSRRSIARRLGFWLSRQRRNTLANSRQNIHRHYDIGNEFYKLWLDEQLVYTCAYFADPEMTLERAQVAKLDHVCRKLALQPGQMVAEAGCGWGALAIHMARTYGVQVRAFNISHEQIVFARERAGELGLSDLVEFVEDDWRNITGSYDAFVSVGMLEHVGLKHYPELGAVIRRCLKPDGRGLIHSIGRNRPRPLDPWTQRRIFPGAYVPALSEMMRIFEPHHLSVVDVENLRLHYAETLRHWLKRFDHAVGRVCEMFDEKFVRTWRLYLAGSVAAFQTGGLQLFQILFAGECDNRVPRTRAHLYTREDAPSELHFAASKTGG